MLKVGGQYDAAPSATGRTVVRIRGKVFALWQHQQGASFEQDDGMFHGIAVGVWPFDTAGHTFTVPTAPEVHPFDPIGAANTQDWMYWERKLVWEDQFVTDGTPENLLGGTAAAGVWEFDIRSKRKLGEMGESLIYCMRPSGMATQGVELFEITTSTLLR